MGLISGGKIKKAFQFVSKDHKNKTVFYGLTSSQRLVDATANHQPLFVFVFEISTPEYLHNFHGQILQWPKQEYQPISRRCIYISSQIMDKYIY